MSLKYKKLIIFLTLGIMGLGMATFSFSADKTDGSSREVDNMQPVKAPVVTASKEPDEDTGLVSASPVPQPTSSPAVPVPTEIEEIDALDIVLENEAHTDIHQLISSYLYAKLDSTSTYDALVSNPHILDAEKLAAEAEVIKGYQNLICYTKKGINEIDFIVYALYDAEILMLTTLVPSMDEFYVCYNLEGEPLIYNDELSEDTLEYINLLRNGSDITKLQEEINIKFMEAIESDSDLKEFVDKISSNE